MNARRSPISLPDDPFSRILCVDDNPTMLQMLKLGFGVYGFDVVTASHGIDALMQFQANAGNFATILTDNDMPNMNGLEFIKQVRALGYKGRVLVMSGRLSAPEFQAYQDYAVSGFLSKPFEINMVGSKRGTPTAAKSSRGAALLAWQKRGAAVARPRNRQKGRKRVYPPEQTASVAWGARSYRQSGKILPKKTKKINNLNEISPIYCNNNIRQDNSRYMYIPADTLDDLLRRIFEKLLRSRNKINPTRGAATELTGVLLKITHPRARLSRTEKKGRLFSALGELLWYLAKTNDVRFVSYYVERYKKESDDGKTIWGGYGPRLFDMKRIGMKGIDQLANIVQILKDSPDSRRAVVQLFDASDIAKRHTDIPCTCTLQFMIRRQRLHMLTNMRSNDAFIGLPHDIFAFTMLQEIMARQLQVEVGTYKQAVGSLHLYDHDRESACQYLKEGWQETVLMPEMPVSEPWPSVKVLLKAESLIRRGKAIDIRQLKIHRYWKDLIRLLQIYWHFRKNDTKKIAQIKRGMSVRIYDPYIDQKKRIANKRAAKVEPMQQVLLKLPSISAK